MIRGALLTLMLAAPPAWAEPPADLREPVSGGFINWTRLTVETEKSWTGRGVDANRRAAEHQAYLHVGEGIAAALDALQVTPSQVFPDLHEDVGLGDALRARASRWYVEEARYYTSQRVDLVGALALPELLRPWTLQRAVEPPAAPHESAYTGVLLDARGTGARAAFAPRVLGPAGEVLWDGAVWTDVATRTSPAVFVADPAHVAAARAGERPLALLAERADGADLVLGPEDAARLLEARGGTRLLGDGRVVIVLDP